MAKKVIFDTYVLIDYLLGIEEARKFVFSFRKEERFLTSVSATEIYRGARNRKELDVFRKFFRESFSEILHFDEEASKLSLELMETYIISHGLALPDALIAAIAISKDALLLTGNLKHFAFIQGLKVSLPNHRKGLGQR